MSVVRDSRFTGGVAQIVFGLGLVVALSGCPKGGEHPTELVCNRDEYIQQSNEYRPDEGEGLAETRSEHPIEKGYFGKPYNRDWLVAVGHASILDTIDYIESKDAVVYRSEPISEKSTLTLHSAEPLPWDLERTWDRAAKGAPAGQCGFLAGLYIGEGSRGIPSVDAHSAIIVREDAARWTLVHEFMHHNFKTQAVAGGYDDDKVQRQFIDLGNQIDALKKNRAISDAEYAKRLLALFVPFIDVADEIVVQYQFEEITVEATLQDEYLKGGLTYVPFGAFTNASWYIAHSKKSAEEFYQRMTAVYDELFRLLSTNKMPGSLKTIARYVELRDRRLAELDEVIAKRKEYLVGKGLVKLMDAVPTEGYAPCGHAREIDDQMAEVAAKLRPGRDQG